VADSDASVLITGRRHRQELVAKAIHYRSLRADKPFVAVNCAAIPANSSRASCSPEGAFTGAVRDKMGRFEEAGSGTLLLDEIADLPVELQAKLLRALQEREFTPVGGSGVMRFEARVIAATNHDLEGDVAEGRFREDLFYRLAVVPIHLPSLRERPEDIPLLVAHFLRALGGGRKVAVSREAMDALKRHPEGNVREARNNVERLLVLGD
jgi:DNA-binding NtrC family response regulator